jgi:hypothetical protein
MPSIEYRPDRPKAWRAIYWGPDGKRHSRSFARESDAKRWLTSDEAAKLQGTWADPNQGRRRFNDWADEWWAVWSADPGRSPKTLEAAESHLRLHIRSHFGTRQLRTITVHAVQQWQNELAGKASYNLTMACRSLLNRILQAATDNRLIPFNPVAKVRPPSARSTRRSSSVGSGPAPTAPRSLVSSWPPAPSSTANISSLRSPPACAAASCSGSGRAAWTWLGAASK